MIKVAKVIASHRVVLTHQELVQKSKNFLEATFSDKCTSSSCLNLRTWKPTSSKTSLIEVMNKTTAWSKISSDATSLNNSATISIADPSSSLNYSFKTNSRSNRRAKKRIDEFDSKSTLVKMMMMMMKTILRWNELITYKSKNRNNKSSKTTIYYWPLRRAERIKNRIFKPPNSLRVYVKMAILYLIILL